MKCGLNIRTNHIRNKMSTKTTFFLPDFDKNIPNKVNEKVEVKSRHVLSIQQGSNYHSAIATSGFSSKTDGVYVFATKIDNIGYGDLFVGFTDVKTYDSKNSGFIGRDLTGTSLDCYDGDRCPGCVPHLSPGITRKAKEIISILTISNNGAKKEIMWIADGNEGPVRDCTKKFGNGDEIFPCISFFEKGQQVEFIPFDQVKSRSPKIDELMKEYGKPIIQITTSAPSTSTAANDALISQLRDQVGRSQDLLIHEKDKQMKNMKELYEKQLEVKDQQLTGANQQVDLSHKHLELERAEHQKTRNLLHQIKMELKDVEIYYLMKEKESGQRRQRDEENDQFKVKQEPSD